MPGGNYRGQGVWVRYTDGSRFSPLQEAATVQPALQVSPTELAFLAARGGSPPPARVLHVTQVCSSFDWTVSTDVPWLQAQPADGTVTVRADQSGLDSGAYSGTVRVSPVGAAGVQPVAVQVRLLVADELWPAYLPFVRR